MHPEIIHSEEKLGRLFEQARKLWTIKEIDDETKSGFVSYVCVRTSGYVEFAVKTILREYSESKTRSEAPIIANYVDNQLENTLNPWRSQILELVGQFSRNWKDALKDSISKKQGESLDSIARNRNDIAHGVDVILSLDLLEDQLDDVKEVVYLVYNVCDPELSANVES